MATDNSCRLACSPSLGFLRLLLLQILRKRQSQEEQNRRKSLRAKGRRVSFAPDDELETRHLFSIVSVVQPPTSTMPCMSADRILQQQTLSSAGGRSSQLAACRQMP